MKKLTLLVVLAIVCFSFDTVAQCKFKNIPAKVRGYCNSPDKPSPALHSKLIVFFDKFYFVGQTSFAKSAENYFLYLHAARNMSKKIALKKTNPIVFLTNGGKTIEIFPTGDYTGKKLLTWFGIGCYYTISKEQLEILASSKVISFKLYIDKESELATQQSMSESWHKDVKGEVFFEHVIEDDLKKVNFLKSAKCILDYK